MTTFREWSANAGKQPVVWPVAKPRTLMRVRCMPAVFAQHDIRVEEGEPFADIGLNRSSWRFPQPYGQNGHPTAVCREWIVENVRAAVSRDGHHRLIIWPDESVTVCNAVPSLRSNRPSDHQEQHP